MAYGNLMEFICWITEMGYPRILGFRDKFILSPGPINHHTPKQFEEIVGSAAAKVALERYSHERHEPTEEDTHGHGGLA